MTELYIQIVDEVFPLDLAENIPITLIKTFKDYKNITNSTIPKTLPIKIPNSNNNREIFSDFLLINGANPETSYQTPISGALYLDGNKLISGRVQVLGFDDQNELIDLVLYNDEIDVFKILKNEPVSAVDFSDLDYTITDASVINSWSGGLNAGKTIVPIADNGQGFGYQDPNNPGTVVDITGAYAVDPKLLSPAFELNEIITRILDDVVNRTDITGWDFNAPTDDVFYFYNLKPAEAQTSPVDLTASGTMSDTNFSIPAGNSYDVDVIKSFDPADLISGGGIVAVHDGNYEIDITALLFPKSGTLADMYLDAYIDGVFDSEVIDYSTGNSNVVSIAMLTGEKLTFKIRNDKGTTFQGSSINANLRITAVGSGGLPIAGGIIYANNYFNKTLKADFFRDLVKMFNLVVYIDENNRLVFDPYETWVEAGSTIDLTDNVLETGYKILSPYDVLYKKLKFQFNEGNDYSNKVYARDSKIAYGTGDFVSDIPFLDKELDNTLSFSPYLRTQLQNNKRGATNLTNLYGIKNTTSPQDIDASAYNEKYLVYYNGFANGGLAYNIGATSTQFVPYFSHYNIVSNNAIQTTDNDLNWFFTSPPIESGYTFDASFDPLDSSSLVNLYYKEYIIKLYNEEAKILDASFVLLPNEFNEIQNNSKIIIDGVIFIILDLKYSVNSFTAKMRLLKII